MRQDHRPTRIHQRSQQNHRSRRSRRLLCFRGRARRSVVERDRLRGREFARFRRLSLSRPRALPHLTISYFVAPLRVVVCSRLQVMKPGSSESDLGWLVSLFLPFLSSPFDLLLICLPRPPFLPGFVAKKLCPHIKLVKSNFNEYDKWSGKVFGVARRYDPDLQKAGCDEGYLVRYSPLLLNPSPDWVQECRFTYFFLLPLF